MKFPREDLVDMACGDAPEGYEIMEDNIEDTTRWSEIHSLVFKHNRKYYATSYSQGLTEMQDEQPFEYEDEEVECNEVLPTKVTVTQYKRKED